MTPFTLATLQTSAGAEPAIGVSGRFYILAETQPQMAHLTCKNLLQDWDASLLLLQALADSLSGGSLRGSVGIDSHAAALLTPVMYPDNLVAVGANYSGHLKEMGLEPEKWQVMPFFLRPPKSTLVGPGPTVRIPRSTKQFDWECELAVFVGKRLRHATREEARAAIAGYGIGLDLSCRDLIQVDNDLKVDLVRGKAQDTMAPCGAWITPAKFVENVDDLRIQLFVNEEKMIDASTSEMLYKVDEQLSVISEYITLEPGDILFTGSPSGSAGVHGNRWLKDGDRIHAEIEHVGTLDVTVHDDH